MIKVSSVCKCRKCNSVYTNFNQGEYTFSHKLSKIIIHTPCANGGECEGTIICFSPASVFDDAVKYAEEHYQPKDEDEVTP